MYTKEELKKQLCELGISPSDTVLIHTSFKAVGGVDGGPDAFIDAFCEYLCDGLFIIPTHTWANVTKEQPIFDYRTTEPCIGLVPKTVAKDKMEYAHFIPHLQYGLTDKEQKILFSVRNIQKRPHPLAEAGGNLVSSVRKYCL